MSSTRHGGVAGRVVSVAVVAMIACGDDDKECTSANHCYSDASGAACEPGYRWENPDDPEDFRCVPASTSQGECRPPCVTAGATECGDGRLRACAARASGCLAWTEAIACGSNRCADAASCAGCSDECSHLNALECSAGHIRRCELDGIGCLRWGMATPCESGSCVDATTCRPVDRCEAMVCNDPPRSVCADSDTMRTYAPSGTCDAGVCSYSPVDTPCPDGCLVGACLPTLTGEIDYESCRGPTATSGAALGVTVDATVGATSLNEDLSTGDKHLVFLLEERPPTVAQPGDVWLAVYFVPVPDRMHYGDGSAFCSLLEFNARGSLSELGWATTCELRLTSLQLASGDSVCDGHAAGSVAADFSGETITGVFELPVDVSAAQLEPTMPDPCSGTATSVTPVSAYYAESYASSGRIDILLTPRPLSQLQPNDHCTLLDLAPIDGQLSYPPGAGARCGIIRWTGTAWAAVQEIAACQMTLSELQYASAPGECDGHISGVFLGLGSAGSIAGGGFDAPLPVARSEISDPTCRPVNASCSADDECCSGSCSPVLGLCN